jgi:hypothetical protein
VASRRATTTRSSSTTTSRPTSAAARAFVLAALLVTAAIAQRIFVFGLGFLARGETLPYAAVALEAATIALLVATSRDAPPRWLFAVALAGGGAWLWSATTHEEARLGQSQDFLAPAWIVPLVLVEAAGGVALAFLRPPPAPGGSLLLRSIASGAVVAATVTVATALGKLTYVLEDRGPTFAQRTGYTLVQGFVFIVPAVLAALVERLAHRARPESRRAWLLVPAAALVALFAVAAAMAQETYTTELIGGRPLETAIARAQRLLTGEVQDPATALRDLTPLALPFVLAPLARAKGARPAVVAALAVAANGAAVVALTWATRRLPQPVTLVAVLPTFVPVGFAFADELERRLLDATEIDHDQPAD